MNDFQKQMDEQDRRIKEMEAKLGQPWQVAILDLINAPCALAIDDLWNKVIYARHGLEYGTWEYPGQAYRHIVAEFDDLTRQRDELLAAAQKARDWLGERGDEADSRWPHYQAKNAVIDALDAATGQGEA